MLAGLVILMSVLVWATGLFPAGGFTARLRAVLRRHVHEFALAGDPDEAAAAMTVTEQLRSAIASGTAIIRNPESRRRMGDFAAQFTQRSGDIRRQLVPYVVDFGVNL